VGKVGSYKHATTIGLIEFILRRLILPLNLDRPAQPRSQGCCLLPTSLLLLLLDCHLPRLPPYSCLTAGREAPLASRKPPNTRHHCTPPIWPLARA
jgi:hypothetical protein